MRYIADKEENRVELVRNISSQAYYSLKGLKDPKTHKLVKRVVSFPYTVKDFISLFLIETFSIGGEVVSLVNITSDNGELDGKYVVPEFLEVVGDVTGKLSRE